MKRTHKLFRTVAVAALMTAACALNSASSLAGPKTVTGPSADPECFVPWTKETKFFQYPAKKAPYRIALANGFIANTWRIQMIKTAKAYAATPEVAAPGVPLGVSFQCLCLMAFILFPFMNRSSICGAKAVSVIPSGPKIRALKNSSM